MQFQLIMGLAIAGLVALYIYLKKTTKGRSEPNLPAVSEDINLPAVSQNEPPSIINNELDNNGSQQ